MYDCGKIVSNQLYLWHKLAAISKLICQIPKIVNNIQNRSQLCYYGVGAKSDGFQKATILTCNDLKKLSYCSYEATNAIKTELG